MEAEMATLLLALGTSGAMHFDTDRILAFGIIVWIWNHLGLSPKATLIGNIVAIILLIILVFFL
jgi:hypothetical protein